MANQNNFKTNVTNQQLQYQKYTVSRVINNLSDDLLRMEMPVDFSFVNLNNVSVEFNLYSIYNNRLVYSTVIQNNLNNGPIYIQKITYADNTFRTFLYVNFTEVPNVSFPEGQYQLVLNIFVNEIGTSDERILKITKISTSRKEVELAITPLNEENINIVKSYIDRSINPTYILPVIKEIYGKLEDEIYIPANRASMTTESIFAAIPSSSKLEDYGFDVDTDNGRYGVKTIIKNILDDAYLLTSSSMSADLLNYTSSFSYETILGYVTSSILKSYEQIMDDNLENPYKYRFDLI